MDPTWSALTHRLTKALSEIHLGQFLVIEYDAQLEILDPYAQVARDPQGYYCEVVSEFYLPRSEWPILVANLESVGWREPFGPDENWSCSLDDDPVEVAAQLLAGLRDGRVCRDPERFRWHVGTFPPGPDGGEPLPAGRMESLRAA